MAIRDVVTRGYGNGTFNGTIAFVVTRGYAIGEAVIQAATHVLRILAIGAESRELAVNSENRAIAINSDKRREGF